MTYNNKNKTFVPNFRRESQTSMTEEDRQYQAEQQQQYRDFYGRGSNKYAVYPNYWPERWGRPPLLGIVYADNEFLAERLSYDRGILPTAANCTFGPRFKNLGPVRTAELRPAR